jgi:hypothetical protein
MEVWAEVWGRRKHFGEERGKKKSGPAHDRKKAEEGWRKRNAATEEGKAERVEPDLEIRRRRYCSPLHFRFWISGAAGGGLSAGSNGSDRESSRCAFLPWEAGEAGTENGFSRRGSLALAPLLETEKSIGCVVLRESGNKPRRRPPDQRTGAGRRASLNAGNRS